MSRREELKQAYQDHPPAAGIYKIKNSANGKIFLGSGMNLHGKLNGEKFMLELGTHYDEALQADWNLCGAEAFTFEIVDVLEPPAGQLAPDPKDLKVLEALWLDKLQPYGERGYNHLKTSR